MIYQSGRRTDIHNLPWPSWGVGRTILCTVRILKSPQLQLLYGFSMLSHLTLLGIECWGQCVIKAMIVLVSMYESQSNTLVGLCFFLKASGCDENPNPVI